MLEIKRKKDKKCKYYKEANVLVLSFNHFISLVSQSGCGCIAVVCNRSVITSCSLYTHSLSIRVLFDSMFSIISKRGRDPKILRICSNKREGKKTRRTGNANNRMFMHQSNLSPMHLEMIVLSLMKGQPKPRGSNFFFFKLKIGLSSVSRY